MQNRPHGGNIWPHLKGARTNVVDFSANINPLGLSPAIRRAILRNIDKLVHYPDPESKYLKRALAKFHGIDEEHLHQ